jgi:hypothetical protein
MAEYFVERSSGRNFADGSEHAEGLDWDQRFERFIKRKGYKAVGHGHSSIGPSEESSSSSEELTND